MYILNHNVKTTVFLPCDAIYICSLLVMNIVLASTKQVPHYKDT